MIKHLIQLSLITLIVTKAAYALEPRDTLGLTPDEYQRLNEYQQQNDRLLLEMIKEKNRQDRERAQDPFRNCISLGEVEGRTIEEVKSLAIGLGASHLQFIQTSATSVRAKAYKCQQ